MATIKQNPEQPIAAEIIAQSIVDIVAAMKGINASRLTRRALVTLIHDVSKVSRKDIDLVLNNLSQLERLHLKPKI